MRKLLLLASICLSVGIVAHAQPDISYYLPHDRLLNKEIPTPKSVIGHEVGELHVSHDRLIAYMAALDQASDRISLKTIGYTHELRPVVLMVITSPDNHQNIEKIRQEHLVLTDPNRAEAMDIRKMPAVFYVGGSIHGNEPSGANAGLLFAYHLAAAQGKEIDAILKNTVILFDPCFNPDGLQRFSTWVNARKSNVMADDSNDMEHHEPWPSGRGNHYWFDLNRDWLVAQHPESQARIKVFHEWKPNVLTDHHEMSTNATFFFQPGVPSRTHPLTPAKNIEITKKLGQYFAKGLDEIGSLYYTQEGFDDFYYGKGSTFPDIQGGIGILFEQASARGHAQQSANGVLRFPFAIRNQFTTALSSVRAVVDLREELLTYQRQFFKDAAAEAKKDPVKAIVVGSQHDAVRVKMLAEILSRHQIRLVAPQATQIINGTTFKKEMSFVVPLDQPQYRLIKSIFEKRTTFTDSIFYDISAWTLPLAAGLDFAELKTQNASNERFNEVMTPGKRVGGKTDYAYVFEPFGYFAPRAINRLLQQDIRIKVATSSFHGPDQKVFPPGSILIPLGIQEKNIAVIDHVIDQILNEDGIDVYNFSTGLDYNGASLGSPSFHTIRKPEIAVLVEGDVNSVDAGEIWHLLDKRFEIPTTMMPVDVFNTTNINKYNTIVLPPGNFRSVSNAAKEKLQRWVNDGGVVIGFENALNWLNANALGRFTMQKDNPSTDSLATFAYEDIDEVRGAQQTSGAIFQVQADLTHPLLFGYDSRTIPVFKSTNLFMERSANPFANPIVYTDKPLLAGYISKKNYERIGNAAYAGVSVVGKGRVIGFTENLAFRAFWFGTNKMLMNAIYFGNVIDARSGR
ncbi:MAG TPA: M14 family metallopeptidase [Chryseosolibacter sp.]|nr:M14 family metallopeptidase [Chryseosolibacter sp.]